MILYFSATGNCKYTANRIADAVNDEAHSIMEYLHGERKRLDISKECHVGLVVPTYAWGIPSVVIDFLQKVTLDCKENEHPYFFFIGTYGTTPAHSGYFAHKYLKKNSGIGFDAFFSVKMPDTWTPMFDLSDEKKVAQINEAVEPQLDEVIVKIKEKAKGNFMKNKVPGFTKVFYAPYYEHMRKTRNFMVEQSCIGCGLCEKKCPVSAIQMQDKRPVWIKDKCTMCLGCLHSCPVFAIQYGKNTKKHGQYRNPHI